MSEKTRRSFIKTSVSQALLVANTSALVGLLNTPGLLHALDFSGVEGTGSVNANESANVGTATLSGGFVYITGILINVTNTFKGFAAEDKQYQLVETSFRPVAGGTYLPVTYNYISPSPNPNWPVGSYARYANIYFELPPGTPAGTYTAKAKFYVKINYGSTWHTVGTINFLGNFVV